MKNRLIQKSCLSFFLFFLLFPLLSLALKAPKYLPGVESLVQSHEYIRSHEAALYWKISPWYISQRNDSACSLAVATMIVNATRSNTVHHELATQDKLLDRVKDKVWNEGVKPGGEGLTLDQLGALMPKALKAYGVNNASVQVVHTWNTSVETAEKLHKVLVQSEKGQALIIANFDQKFFSGIFSGGHFAPVGAYDAEKKRVLLMDPDREFFEPYWVPEALFLKSMVSKDDETGKFRGYLIVR